MGYYEPASHKGLFGISVLWIVGVIVVVLAISAGLWAFGVFTSDIKGAGDAIRERNSATNRVQKQEMFEQLAADYDGYVLKIKAAETAVQEAGTDTDRELRQTELVGLRQVCIDAAQQFNAESRKYSSRVWKSAGLPPALDATSCQ